ncbi:VPLPA-CTERM sorting domain-containing protein [Hyphococcus luteus]|nr:VPLPA-CTERM sorting domain-containing protein [Marinicaulis flavus]
MMSRLKFAVAAGAASLAAAGPASAAEIFFDSFEAPDVADWAVFQVAGDGSDWTAEFGTGIEIQDESLGITDAYDGEQYVELDSDFARGGDAGASGTNSGMGALVPFVEGRTYDISFAYKPRTDVADDNIIQLYALAYDGADVDNAVQLFEVNETTSTLSDWMVYTVSYTALAGFNGIGFAADGIENSLGGFLDAVSVSEVPLPAALPLFLAGVAGFGFAGRKRKAAA